MLEGRGYDLHQDCDVEITDTYHWKPQDEVKRYEWEAGDVIYIPPNTIHQHFNADPDRPVRLISAINRVYRFCGLNDLEQIEDALYRNSGLTALNVTCLAMDPTNTEAMNAMGLLVRREGGTNSSHSA